MVQRSTKQQTTLGGIILALLVGLYSYAQPYLNERFHWQLPSLAGTSDAGSAQATLRTDRVTGQLTGQLAGQAPKSDAPPVASFDKKTAEDSSTPTVEKASSEDSTTAAKDGAEPAASSTERKSNATKPGPLAGRVPKPAANSPKDTPPKASAQQTPAKPVTGSQDAELDEDSSLKFGLLKDLGGERYVSPAGLLYTRGSAEGHRLSHLERHTVDDPRRPGKHGVFDGGMAGALKTIDRAYERAKTGQKTTKELDEGRVIYTVDMGGRVGYIGGQDGNRQKKPMARRVRIVLDQQRVITAYPM